MLKDERYASVGGGTRVENESHLKHVHVAPVVCQGRQYLAEESLPMIELAPPKAMLRNLPHMNKGSLSPRLPFGSYRTSLRTVYFVEQLLSEFLLLCGCASISGGGVCRKVRWRVRCKVRWQATNLEWVSAPVQCAPSKPVAAQLL